MDIEIQFTTELWEYGLYRYKDMHSVNTYVSRARAHTHTHTRTHNTLLTWAIEYAERTSTDW